MYATLMHSNKSYGAFPKITKTIIVFALVAAVFAVGQTKKPRPKPKPEVPPIAFGPITLDEALPQIPVCSPHGTYEDTPEKTPCLEDLWVRNIPYHGARLTVFPPDGPIQSMNANIQNGMCDEVLRGLVLKFGSPTSSLEIPMMNNQGARWTDNSYFWYRTNGDELNFSVSKFLTDKDCGIVVAKTAASIAKENAERTKVKF